ncbi:MAG: MerR family transcriptional regulator [Rhodospirillaceae bacterium]
MTTYTVKQMASLSGVSVRTLHHYDAIDLLKPADIGENGYRTYGRKELLRLQHILFHKEVGLPLADIAAILDDPTFDSLKALEAHKLALVAEAAQREVLIKTLTRTVAALSGNGNIADSDLYKGFPPEQQSDYACWLIENYGGDMEKRIADSTKAYAKMSAAERKDTMTELALIEQGLAEGLRHGEPADSPAHDLLLNRHRAWIAFMWDRPCPLDSYAGLADLYLSHPDFEQRYEQIEPGFTAYLTDAMKAYADRAVVP